jgi:SAM-dependent methyltransferase
MMYEDENGGGTSEWERTYRKLRGDEVLWSSSPEIEDLLPPLRASRAKRVLDAGCGDGKNLAALLREPGLFCVGCDSSRTALEICEREVQKRNASQIEGGQLAEGRARELCLVHTQLADMPFLDGYFDAAVCIDVVNHNRDPYPLLAEVRRVVRPGGLVYLSLFNVDDDILQDPRSVLGMAPITGGIQGREFTYHFINGSGSVEEYYFRFLKVDEVPEFLRPTGLTILDVAVKHWWNPPHPYFRPYEHTHCNIMVMAKNG